MVKNEDQTEEWCIVFISRNSILPHQQTPNGRNTLMYQSLPFIRK
jgi:hypothetical protein